jgi:hypothetical protein
MASSLKLRYYTRMLKRLLNQGFQVQFCSHAEAILAGDFPAAVAELESALSTATIPIEEIIAGGGGEAKGTQRLRRALTKRDWVKTTFTVEKRINGVPKESQSHQVDHVRAFGDSARIALEIEWNNKDPFFDRDLENYKRLHADGAISVGIIVTRGTSLQSSMRDLVKRFLRDRGIKRYEALDQWGYEPTGRQREELSRRMTRKKAPLSFHDAFAEMFVSDKFGEATTHWRKLEERIQRGIGNPCPLVLIGLPSSIVTFDEVRSGLAEAANPEWEAEPL